MDRLFDETFASEGDGIVSRNIWYGYVELYTDAEYGKQIVLDDKLLELICGIVGHDLSENTTPAPTETNWYLYGATKTTDAIEDSIRPTIMIRHKRGGYLARVNMSDNDFAVNIDVILSFESKLQKVLSNG